MDIFSALADPTRRSILELLTKNGELSATQISEQFQISPPAISQHLKVLREAKLVLVEKRAQQRIYRVNRQAMLELEEWAGLITQHWNQRFDALEQVLQAEKQKALQGERINRMPSQSPRDVTLTRVFDAPRELVFKAFTDPQLMAQWWGPKYFDNPLVELDVRPGGALLIHMRAPDGTIYPNKGIFREIVPPERIVFTSGAFEDENGLPELETLTTVTLTEQNGQTLLTLQAVVTRVTTPAAEQALAGMEEGWSQSLDKLAEQLTTVRNR